MTLSSVKMIYLPWKSFNGNLMAPFCKAMVLHGQKKFLWSKSTQILLLKIQKTEKRILSNFKP